MKKNRYTAINVRRKICGKLRRYAHMYPMVNHELSRSHHSFFVSLDYSMVCAAIRLHVCLWRGSPWKAYKNTVDHDLFFILSLVSRFTTRACYCFCISDSYIGSWYAGCRLHKRACVYVFWENFSQFPFIHFSFLFHCIRTECFINCQKNDENICILLLAYRCTSALYTFNAVICLFQANKVFASQFIRTKIVTPFYPAVSLSNAITNID